MNYYVLPLQNIPQKFNTNLAGREVIIINRWNDMPEGGWVMDIQDGVTELPIICNIACVVGADLLEQLEYLGLGGMMYVATDGDPRATPTLDNLGIESNVYYLTEE